MKRRCNKQEYYGFAEVLRSGFSSHKYTQKISGLAKCAPAVGVLCEASDVFLA
jgi:hypothetical protein